MPKKKLQDGTGSFQLPLPNLIPKSPWKPPKISELPSWAGVKRVSIDVETCDPDLKILGPGIRRNGYIVGYSFAFEDGPSFYVPYRHQGGDNVDASSAILYIRDQFRSFKGEVVGANLGYDLDYLASEGVDWSGVSFFRDVQNAEPLLDELHFDYNLNAIAERHGVQGKDDTLLNQAAVTYNVDPKKGLWRLPARYVGAYAEQDVRLPLTLLRRQEKLIDEQELWNVWNLECRLQPVLVRMRRRGVKVNLERVRKVEKWAIKEQELVVEEIKHRTGITIKRTNFMNPTVLAPVFEAIGVTLKKTKTGKPSIDKNVLKRIDHPVAQAISRGRKLDKYINTYCSGIKEFQVKGRIHGTINQLKRSSEDEEGGTEGAITGRVSMKDPNLQNQPIRDPEMGAVWRGVFEPDDDCDWYCLDYSQQEPRMTVHFAELCNLPGAAVAGDKFRNDPSTDFHAFMAEITQLPRKDAKQIFLAVAYGMGGPKLCQSLGYPIVLREKNGRKFWAAGKEGQAIINQFDVAVPFVRALSRYCERVAKKRGYIKTLSGRRLHFPKDAAGNFDWAHKAFNKLAQGSSADQMKMAMVAADQAGFPLQLQVHDELDISLPSPKLAGELAEIMENVVKLSVPSKTDVESGKSWGEIDEEGKSACRSFYGEGICE